MANKKPILYKEYRVKPIANDNNVHRIVVVVMAVTIILIRIMVML